VKTLNVFGTSQKFEELSAKEKSQLFKRTNTLGINLSGIKYPVKYLLFSDCGIAQQVVENKYYLGKKILTNQHCFEGYFKNIKDAQTELIFEPNNIQDSVGNSAFFAIWYAVQFGYDKVNLFGVLDDDETNYEELANGMTRYYNALADIQHTMWTKDHNYMKWIIETGYGDKIKICQPLKH
jgi:hypothetical protein